MDDKDKLEKDKLLEKSEKKVNEKTDSAEVKKEAEKPADEKAADKPAEKAPEKPPEKKPDETKAEEAKKPSRFDLVKSYVFDPTEDIYYRWLILISIAVLYNFLFIIGRASFNLLQSYNPILWFILDYLCDFIYLIDIFVRLRTGYLEQGLLLRDCNKLALNYLKSFQFKLDIFCLIPFELFTFFFARFMPALRFNRLAKYSRLSECRLKIETQTSHPFLFRIIYLLLLILVVIHWNGCFYFLISKEIGIGEDKWVFNYNDDNISGLVYEYLFCFFWSTLMMTTIGEVNPPETNIECIVMIVNFLVAIVIFATLVGNIGSVIANMNIQQNVFQQRVDSIKSLMKLRKVSAELDRRVVKWFDYLLKNNQTVDEIEILKNLPDKLAIEISSEVYMETLKNVVIFSDCDEALLRELVTKLKVQVYSPGDFVCKKGDIGKEMYIIKKGSLNVVSDDETKVFVTLKAGAYFGEISILNIPGSITGNRRTANVKSVGYSELIRLTKNDLWEALADYPMNKVMIMEKGRAKLRKDNLLDESKEFKKAKVIFGTIIDSKLENEYKDFAECPAEEKFKKIESIFIKLNNKIDEIDADINETFQKTKTKIQTLKLLKDKKIGITV